MNAIYEAIDEFEFSNAVFPMTQEYANWETDAVILCTKWAKSPYFVRKFKFQENSISSHCLKITEKVSFNSASEASYLRLHFEWTKVH